MVDSDDANEFRNEHAAAEPKVVQPAIVKPLPVRQQGRRTNTTGTGSNINVNLGISATYASQLPPAHEIEKLENLLPGTLDRLLAIQESITSQGVTEQTHRHVLEDNDDRRRGRGQIIGAAVFVIGIGAAVFLAATNHENVAKVIGGATLLGVVVVFATGTFANRRRTDD